MQTKIKPLDLIPMKQPTIKPDLRRIVMNERGIEELLDVITALLDIATGVQASLEDDGEVTWTDVGNFASIPFSVIQAISGLSEVPDELADEITDEEFERIKSTILDEYDIVPDEADEMVEEGLELAIDLKNFIFKWFVPQPPVDGEE